MNFRRKLAQPVSAFALASLALVHCGDKAHCEQLRQDTYAARVQWAQCQSDSDCIVLQGNPGDCTGVLTCPFGVNLTHRQEAELKLLQIGDDSLDCHLCATPNCSLGTASICEPTSHQCLILATSFEAGARRDD
jgi:hypothetical protein